MLRFIVRLFAFIGFLVVAAIVASVVLVREHKPSLPDAVVLDLDLREALSESDDAKLGGIFGHETTLREVLDALDRGRRDPRVKGVLARFGGDQIGFAQAQELRTAVERFRAAGRFAIAYADAYGDSGSGNRSYLLASAFDEVWMQPLGLVGLTGMAAEIPFARGALDALGIQPQIQQREEYKSFADTFTRSELTPANREMVEALLGDLTAQVVDGVAKSRRLAPAAVRAAMDRAPLLDHEALDAKLIDRLAYADEAQDEALNRAGTGADLVEPQDYLRVAGPANDRGTAVALVRVVGTITSGKSEKPGLSAVTAGSETIVEAIEDAADDPAVRAILVRIDSGGGGVSASESIYRALRKARQAGKPVIASMGDTAASGAYWLALAADRIVAEPGTTTGSIGVVAGKMAANGLSEKLGVHWGSVSTGRNAGMWSPLQPFTPSQEERLTAIIDSSYSTFLTRVAEARHMTPDQAHAAAKGRVWSGARARDLGLIDELGDQETALALVRQAIKLEADAPVSLVAFPKPKAPLDELLDLASGKGDLVESVALLAQVRPLLAPLAPLLRDAQARGVQARMPALELAR